MRRRVVEHNRIEHIVIGVIRTYFRVVLLDEDDPDHNDVNEIPYGWVQVEGRNHVHDGEQIGLDIPVLMESHHGRVGDN